MKKMIAIIAVALTIASCKKDDAIGYSDEFAGEWEYMRSETAWGISNLQPAGNGRIISLGNNGSFERKSHSTILFSGNYSLSKKKDCYGDKKWVFIKTDDAGFPNDYIIGKKGDSLTLSTSNCFEDGGIAIYRKL